MSINTTELRTVLDITSHLNETLSRTIDAKFPPHDFESHSLDISITDSAYEGTSILNISVIHTLSQYSFDCRLMLHIKDQDDTTHGIRHSADHLTVRNLMYDIGDNTIEHTAPLRIHKNRNGMGLHTYKDIADMIVEVIDSIRQYTK